jgi:hypothetical protein
VVLHKVDGNGMNSRDAILYVKSPLNTCASSSDSNTKACSVIGKPGTALVQLSRDICDA